MSFFVWCEIVCRNCSDSTAGQFTTGAVPRRDMSATAKKHGWALDPGRLDEWICPPCQAESTTPKARHEQ